MCGLDALTAVQMPETECSALRACNMQTRQPDAHHGGYEPLGHEGAPCMFTASRPSTQSVKGKASAQWGCVCPKAFSTFEDRSFGGLSDVLKKRLGVGLPGSLTACTFRRLVHVSLAADGLRSV